MHTLILYAIATVVFFGIDMLWIGLIARNFYKQHLGFIMSGNYNWAAIVIFYLLYIGGILYFAVLPALKAQSWQLALINGAALGLLCYCTYDLTNKGTIEKWPWIVVIADVAWGAFITCAVSFITYLIGHKLFFYS